MLSKSQLTKELVATVAEELHNQFNLKLSEAQARKYADTAVKVTLAEMEGIAEDEISQGNDFTVPGICRISWSASRAVKKGEKYKKGETYVGFGGEEKTAEADSPAKPARIKLKATPVGRAKSPAPSKEEMASFVKSKTGKAILARKVKS